MVELEGDLWYWYHSISERYYHIQLTVKYGKALLDEKIQQVVVETIRRFLPKYSGGQVIRTIKSITGQQIFEQVPGIKKELWGGAFWTDGYYIGTISGKGNKDVIEKYIKSQGREKDIRQLLLLDI